MRKINKKILSLILVISGSFGLSACQLAKEEGKFDANENLRGAFITFEADGEEYTYDDVDKKYYGTFDENLFDKDIKK